MSIFHVTMALLANMVWVVKEGWVYLDDNEGWVNPVPDSLQLHKAGIVELAERSTYNQFDNDRWFNLITER